MQITFILGNGFDLRLGMKTRYMDMYEGYIASESKSEEIEDFKKLLKEDSYNSYENWSDFEMAVARFANSFRDEQALITCVRDFKSYLREHLVLEQKKFFEGINLETSNADLTTEMKKSLSEFHKGQTPNVVNEIAFIAGRQKLEYACEFITFNYTTVLDWLVSKFDHNYSIVRPSGVVHVHGKLNEDIVLGIDNISQLSKVPFKTTRKLDRAFIKTKFNEEYDVRRVENAKKLIRISDIIYIYGMSLGESDETWVSCIRDWLLENQKHHLFYYVYSETDYTNLGKDEIMDLEDDEILRIAKKLKIDEQTIEQVSRQIHIPIGHDIFEFKKVLETRATRPQPLDKLG